MELPCWSGLSGEAQNSSSKWPSATDSPAKSFEEDQLLTPHGNKALHNCMSSFKIQNIATGDKEKQNLLDRLPELEGRKILIVGDIGLDEYILGDVRRISPEAPVPVLEVSSEDLRLGLAANVAQNVVSLGGQAVLVAVVGDDSGADRLKDLFKKKKGG